MVEVRDGKSVLPANTMQRQVLSRRFIRGIRPAPVWQSAIRLRLSVIQP